MSRIFDLFASEYGFSPEYVSNNLSVKEIEFLMDRIKDRYRAEAGLDKNGKRKEAPKGEVSEIDMSTSSGFEAFSQKYGNKY